MSNTTGRPPCEGKRLSLRMPPFNETAYLSALGLTRPLVADLNYLQTLTQRHLHRIPFENLDIHLGIPIQFDLDHLFTKIISQGRGGFCYELNGLFYALLQCLGYQVWLISARVYDNPRKYSPAYDHMAIVVQLSDGIYLADVGFGSFSEHPIRLEEGVVTHDGATNYRVDRYYQYYRISAYTNQQWIPEYICKLNPQPWQAFHNRSLYHQYDDGSHFRKGPVITKLTAEGRITLTDQKLKFQGKAKPVENMEQFAQLLYRHFGLSWKDLRQDS